MFRNNTKYPSSKSVNFLLLDGGLGDHVASLVALKYVHQQYPWIKPIVFVPDYLKELSLLALPNGNIRAFSEMKAHYDPNKPTKTTKWDGHTSPMKVHPVDYAFLKLCDELPGMEHRNYVNIGEKIGQYTLDISKYVVITTGYTASVREFPAKEINAVSKWLLSNGITPVYLGQTQTKTGLKHEIKGNFDSQVDFTVGINLIDKTNLVEAVSVMKGALAVIGVDNGLLHLAGMCDTNIIAGYTTVSPMIRMPIRSNIVGLHCYPVVPDQSLACSFCQEKTNFLYGHNYTTCYYKDTLCVKQMTAKKFINALEALI